MNWEELVEEATHHPKKGFDVREREGMDVVVFRPTEGTAWDWIWNFFVAPFGGIHSGFAWMYVGIVNRVLRVLEIRERRRGERWPVIFTGFSRGGALAEMCAVDSVFEPWKPKAVSFAAPRWTVKRIEAPQVERIQCGGDVVCRVPPWPYRDVGKVVRLRWKWIPSFRAHGYSVYREAVYGA